MANELRHQPSDRAAATAVTQAEFDSITAHKFNNQATGDIPYAPSASGSLTRLAIGAAGTVLQPVGGIPAWQAYLALGATPAGTGTIRLPTGLAGGIYFKNNAGNNDAGTVYADSSDYVVIAPTAGVGVKIAAGAGDKVGFYGSAGAAKQTVTGSKGGNAALGSLLTALAAYGLVTDNSS